MPRPPRADEAGAVYHALDRGNAREPIFHKEEDFAGFERVIGLGLETVKRWGLESTQRARGRPRKFS